MKGLTEKQKAILNFIEEFSCTEGMAPTVYEIAKNFAIKTSTVFAHVRALQRKGELTRSSKARSICLTRPRRKQRNPTGLRAIPMREGEDGRRLFCDATLVGSCPASDVRNLYVIRVHGTKLRQWGIFDGDFAIIRKYPHKLKPGDIILNRNGTYHTCSKINGDEVECISLDANHLRSSFFLSEDPPSGVIIGVQRAL